MTTLACTVSQKSLTKNFIIQSMERKKIGQMQERISRRRLVCNPTIQHVIINPYTKYDFSSLHGCGEIFDEKVLRNYGRTDGRTDGMTDRCKPVYPPLFQSGGIIIYQCKFEENPSPTYKTMTLKMRSRSPKYNPLLSL